MANKLKLNPEVLDIEYQMLQSELESLDELYEEAKERLDIVAKTPTRANPVFMASQTANLISIKEKKLNIIKELANLKKSKIDLNIKEFNANNKLDEIETGYSKDILDIYRLLNKNDKSELLQTTIEDNNNEDVNIPSDEEFDAIFEEKINSNKKVEEDNKKKELKKLPDGYTIVCDEDKNLYIIDEDYNIIEDLDYDLSVIKIIRFEEVNDEESYGYDEDGIAYEVVEL